MGTILNLENDLWGGGGGIILMVQSKIHVIVKYYKLSCTLILIGLFYN